jgi:Methyltransferase domain
MIPQKTNASSDPISKSFFEHEGRLIHKWHHFLPLYHRYFEPFRNGFNGKPLRFLEIGVSQGGSLEMWRKYFGQSAIIYGIDINPACAVLDGENGNIVRIGSQDDPEFLRRVVAEMGGVDIILDDGSHVAKHLRTSFDVLFPLLSDGGMYCVEDLHTSYWPKYGGGYQKKSNFFRTVISFNEVIKQIIDDMHHWHHKFPITINSAKDKITGFHMHESIVFFEKNTVEQPVNSQIGTPLS